MGIFPPQCLPKACAPLSLSLTTGLLAWVVLP